MSLLDEFNKVDPFHVFDFLNSLTPEENEQLLQEMYDENTIEIDEHLKEVMQNYLYIKNKSSAICHAELLQNSCRRALIPYKKEDNDTSDGDYFAPTYKDKWRNLYTNEDEFDHWCLCFERDYENLKEKLNGDYPVGQKKNAVENINALADQICSYYDEPKVYYPID